MLTRRHFLATSTAAASVALCRPAAAADMLTAPAGSPDEVQDYYLKQRKQKHARQPPQEFLGYPANLNPAAEGMRKWCRELQKTEFGALSMNNVGDPFRSRSVLNSQMLEADVVERFAERYGFPGDNVWGFVSHSGTDSNMHGAYIGRTLLQQRTGRKPKIFYTREAHYSIQIVRDMLCLDEVLVDTRDDASMDIDDLERKLARYPDDPVLLIATIGTTFKGGIDDIDKIQEKLARRESYLHLDAALFGGYLQASPYADLLQQEREGKRRYDSIAVSWHKFFGFHAVAGLFICCRDDFEQYREYFSQVHDPAYISHVPGTITCSRDPIKPAQVHYYSTLEAFARQQADAMLVLENAAYLHRQMQANFPTLDARRVGSLSNIVYFDNRIGADVVRKWTLATIAGADENHPGMAHVVVMPHASKTLLDDFLNDVEAGMKGA